jgi:hypothetical protein
MGEREEKTVTEEKEYKRKAHENVRHEMKWVSDLNYEGYELTVMELKIEKDGKVEGCFHTATTTDMEHITALSLLSKFDKYQSLEYKKCLMALVDCYLGFKKKIINKMYRKNKDTFYDVLPQNIIKDIMNME